MVLGSEQRKAVSQNTWPRVSRNIPTVLNPLGCWSLGTKLSAKLLQSCPTLCNPLDCSPPGSSVHGLLQATILEQVAISSSRGPFQPRDQTHVSCVSCFGRQILYQLSHKGSPEATGEIVNRPCNTTHRDQCLRPPQGRREWRWM